VLQKIVEELLGHRPRESLVGHRRVVARGAEHADFVLHLHHDDRVRVSVHLADVLHQRGKGARIGVAVGFAQCVKVGKPLPFSSWMIGNRCWLV